MARGLKGVPLLQGQHVNLWTRCIAGLRATISQDSALGLMQRLHENMFYQLLWAPFRKAAMRAVSAGGLWRLLG